MSPRTRRDFLRAGGLLAAAALLRPTGAHARERTQADSAEEASPGEFELVTSPRRVFKVRADQDRERLEGWLTTLILRTTVVDALGFESLIVRYRQGESERLSIAYAEEALRAVNMVAPPQTTGARGSGPPFAMRLLSLQPQAQGIDRAICGLTVRVGAGRRVRVTNEIPLEDFRQATALVFPFRGHGIITQGGALNDGHRNRSGQFAVDAMALTDRYAVMARDGDASEAAAGWGRPILAPAGGVVASARSDRPDQPEIGRADARYFAAGFPDGGDPGNHVVIDHENGEFSMVAHFQQHSLKVKAGDRVVQGQDLGRLGSSGDSSAPHVHHQLQAGPSWTSADGLPHHYLNGPKRLHDRGTMFRAE